MEKERLKGSLYISTKDIQVLNGCSLRHAQRELKALTDILQIRRDRITVKAYCEYWGLDYDEVISHINPYR
ncbi:MAG: hypothetical protein HUJ25_12430 [Crocinitomicaceae bacterium]|nr:hypothetical protein [Crocinitomicaceae bacterium]